MKTDSKIIKTENKIPKEKVYQFVLRDKKVELSDSKVDAVEDIKAMSLKKAVKSFQNKYDKEKIAKVYYINKKGHRLFSIIKLKVGRKKKLGRWS